MTEITAEQVKALREKTGQSMMECKKALVEAHGDPAAAMDLLRKKGLSDATKRAARTTKEGLVAISGAGNAAAMVEVVCETDFCARNAEFRAMVQKVAELAAQGPAGPIPATGEITEAVQACFNKIHENMRFGRGIKIAAPKVATYLHHNSKVGVLLGIEGDLPAELLNDLCMHIAFADPLAIRPEELPAELVAKERQLALEQAQESGKPPAVQEKIVQGKVGKFLAANALLEQPFVKDEKKKVKDVLGPAKITAFARFQVGP